MAMVTTTVATRHSQMTVYCQCSHLLDTRDRLLKYAVEIDSKRHRSLCLDFIAQFAADWAVCLATHTQRYIHKMARIVLVRCGNIGLSTIWYGRGALRHHNSIFLSEWTELDVLSLSMFGMYVWHGFATLLLRGQLSWCVGAFLLKQAAAKLAI